MEGINRPESLGRPKSITIWFSGSCIFAILPKLVQLGSFSLADHFLGPLEKVEDFALGASIAAEDPRFGFLTSSGTCRGMAEAKVAFYQAKRGRAGKAELGGA